MGTNGYQYGGLKIEAAANGFIVENCGTKWVFTTIKSALKFIEDSFKEEAK